MKFFGWGIGAELRGLFCESSLHFLTSDILNKKWSHGSRNPCATTTVPKRCGTTALIALWKLWIPQQWQLHLCCFQVARNKCDRLGQTHWKYWKVIAINKCERLGKIHWNYWKDIARKKCERLWQIHWKYWKDIERKKCSRLVKMHWKYWKDIARNKCKRLGQIHWEY